LPLGDFFSRIVERRRDEKRLRGEEDEGILCDELVVGEKDVQGEGHHKMLSLCNISVTQIKKPIHKTQNKKNMWKRAKMVQGNDINVYGGDIWKWSVVWTMCAVG